MAQTDMFAAITRSPTFYLPDDALDINEKIWLDGSRGYEERVEWEQIQNLSSNVLVSIRRAKKVSIAQPFIDKFIKWRDDNLAEISKSLETNFPGRWEIFHVIDFLSPEFVEMLAIKLVDCEGNMVNLNLTDFIDISCKITVYFPEIVITNTLGHVWTIKDYYVIINLDPRFCVNSMRGYRATKTWKEYKLNYTHSHSRTASNELVPFCFGTTSLDTLIAELRFSFDMLKLELLFQNLTDYLSWESLEGSPYMSIKELITTASPGQRRPEIHDNTMMEIVKIILRANLKLPVSISIINGEAFASLPRSIELLRLITPLVLANYLHHIDEVRIQSTYVQRDDIPTINARIKDLNRALKGDVKFSFRGNKVFLRIEEMEEKEEKKIELELFADTRIMDKLIHYVEQNLTSYLNDSYWYGIEERGVPKS